MAGHPYGGNPPQYPTPQNQIYPQLYNPSNAPSPGALSYAGPGQNPPFPPTQQPGFAPYPYGQQQPPQQQSPQQQPPPQQYPPQQYPPQQYPPQQYPPQQYPPAQHGQPPATMTYPGANPTAPPFGQGHQNPTQFPPSAGAVEWRQTTAKDANFLSDRAVVGGYEGYDNSPLWVIRARYEGDLIPGKLAVKHQSAYVPWNGKENAVHSIEVCCAAPNRVRWVETSNGIIPVGAIPGGNTTSGETLYIGRAKQQGSLTPGKVHPSHNSMYISFAGKEVSHKTYEILCTV